MLKNILELFKATVLQIDQLLVAFIISSGIIGVLLLAVYGIIVIEKFL